MTDLRKRVGDAMQHVKPRANGHVMFEDVRDAAIRAVLDELGRPKAAAIMQHPEWGRGWFTMLAAFRERHDI